MKLYIKIKGIHCQNCETKIINKLTKINNINKVTIKKNIAIIDYQEKIDIPNIKQNIEELGYIVKSISDKEFSNKINLLEMITILSFIFLIYFALKNTLGLDLFNMIPSINNNISLGMLFVVGLFTSIHCISMCGAINLMATMDIKRSYKKPLLYNLGRLISYTIIGGLVGLLGSIFQINYYVEGSIIIIASVLMFIMASNMLGIINIKLPKIGLKIRSNNAFSIGLLNGLMPCGPLQAMEIYALSTGSIIYGALAMFLFGLGTIPLMFGVGVLANIISNKKRIIFNKIASILILILSLIMLNRGLLTIGVDINHSNNYQKSIIYDNYQYIEFDLEYSHYKDIVVQKGIPVKVVINVTEDRLTGCNNVIIISEFNIKYKLKVGQNIIEFTPTEEGIYYYTCWMRMIKNNIKVIDDIDYFERR